jgi:phospholipid/cholesterol/gamma-HCH transport system substrate-binding protein
MTGSRTTILKFGTFAAVMIVLTAFLLMVFGQYRGGSTSEYSAVFADASGLKPGDTVRAGGLEVGTVRDVSMRDDHRVVVSFDSDRSVPLSTGTKVAARYLNVVGDRYLELVDGPGSTRLLPPGSEIGLDKTTPALDLDLLLGGLKPVIQGLNPQDVNALTAALLQVFQGQGGTLESVLAKTASFSNGLADNNDVIERLIDNLNVVVGILNQDGGKFADAIDRFEKLMTGLSADRDTIGTAIDSLSNGTASIADLLAAVRPPLAGTVDQLNRLAPLLDEDKARLDTALQKAPENFRKLTRLGAYGSFINEYSCGLQVRVTDLQGRTAVFPWVEQTTGRCQEP